MPSHWGSSQKLKPLHQDTSEDALKCKKCHFFYNHQQNSWTFPWPSRKTEPHYCPNSSNSITADGYKLSQYIVSNSTLDAVYLSSQDFVHERVHVFAIESMFQRCHFIDTAAQRPYIRLQITAQPQHCWHTFTTLCPNWCDAKIQIRSNTI